MGDDQNHEQGCPHCNHCRRKLIVKRWRDGETQMDIAAALARRDALGRGYRPGDDEIS